MNVAKKIGVPAVLEQMAEECAELAHACLKEARRLRGENPTPATMEECKAAIKEEMADVAVCMDVLMSDTDDYWICPDTINDKMERWKRRIEEQK